jgi:hypothetical protein
MRMGRPKVPPCEDNLSNSDRRARVRFPLNADLRFHVIRRGQGRPIQGSGEVVNMSSNGLAFSTELPLERGQRLAVSVAWPALLDHKCRLRLSVEGTIVRTDGRLVALAIESHDFRTSGRGGPAARQELEAIARTIEPLLGPHAPAPSGSRGSGSEASNRAVRI